MSEDDRRTAPPWRQRNLPSTLAAAIRLTREASPSALRTTLLLATVTALIPPAIVWLGKHLVDVVVAEQRGGTSSPGLVPTVVLLGLASAAVRGLGTLRTQREELFGSIVEAHAERRLLESVAVADLGHFDQPEWHDRAARAMSQVGWRPFQVTNSLVGVAASGVGLVGMLALLATLSPLLIVLATVSVIPSTWVYRRTNRELHQYWRRTTSHDRRRGYLRDLLSKAEPATEVRAYGLGDHLLALHREVIDARLSALRQLHSRAGRRVVVTAVTSGLALAVAYGFVASEGVAGRLTPGDLVLLIGAFGAALGQLTGMLAAMVRLDENARFLEDYFSFLHVERLLPVAADPVPLPERLDEGVRFEGVTFTYPTGQEPALRDLNLEIGPGEMVALVGENGAGKTTLVKLLLRFYDAQGGRVLVGGVDVKDADPAEVRERIGVLFQDFTHYESSARSNVGFGRVDREPLDPPVLDALTIARADQLVAGLPQGLDSNVGRLFEGSHDLSGGEWQRLALARLLFRDADVWVLDEPTSALDPEAEAEVFAHLRKLLHDRIALVISHRFSTVRAADRIAVLSDGTIVEHGTHEELLAAEGVYARLFELQAAGYR